ncbi:sorting nexin-18-like [Xenia sp. Carnegie-2017]|uniref:sorting nexin-18-like n=1 Tax=Xenia sp. Carnegie-2017 TaxID=2897299 RepID=UPI001F04964B|nr:sorting nexin-18-like [Xenia sp. Carnegie-2017]
MAFKVKVLYDFEGEAANGELTISENEILTVTDQNVGDGWWEGVNASGKKGLFPESYVETITNNAPSVVPKAPLRSQSTVSGDDSWDDETDGENEPASIGSSSTSNSLEVNGEARLRSMTSGKTMKKSFNRFSVFVKSGGESFLLGTTAVENNSIKANDVALIVETSEGVRWEAIQDPFTCLVTQPEKKSKFKGMKHFIAYNVTPSSTNVAVSRRFKHFDWLYDRLVEKFTCLSIPRIPEKQITGKYAEDFVEKRRERLEKWLNRLCRHPLISNSEVFQHFLLCKDDEKLWKAGKRKAENDKLCGAAFFLTVRCPRTNTNIDEADVKIEEFSLFVKSMEQSVHRFLERFESLSVKYTGVFQSSFKKFGSSFTNLSSVFEQHGSSNRHPLTDAIAHTGRTFDEIGDLYNEQPQVDFIPFMEDLHEYSGILSTFPELIHVHKSTVEKVKDCEKKQNEPDSDGAILDEVSNRANVITNVMFSEIDLFHQQRIADYKNMMQQFLRQEIQFYQGIVKKLQDSLQMYENVV